MLMTQPAQRPLLRRARRGLMASASPRPALQAEELGVAAVAMARHTKSKLQEFFLGSCTNYVLKHCKAPLVIYHT